MDCATLFSLANILFCAAYIVRRILWLRVITIVACLSTLPYFYFQPTPLYSAIFWQSAFIVINAINLIILTNERRPIELSHEEDRLHTLVFRSLTPRELLKLIRIGEWREASPEYQLVKHGEALDCLMLIYSGSVDVRYRGELIGTSHDGHFIGDMSYMTGQLTSADVIVNKSTRYLYWDKKSLKDFLDRESGINSVVQEALSLGLVAKLEERKLIATYIAEHSPLGAVNQPSTEAIHSPALNSGS